MWIVRLDRRARPPGEVRRSRDLDEWLKRSPPRGGPRGWKEDEDERRGWVVDGIATTWREYWQTVGEKDTEVRLCAAVYALEDGVELALVFNGPGGRKASKHRNAARALAKTLERVPLVAAEEPAAGGTLRDRRRAALAAELERSAGWELSETTGFLIVAESGDPELVREVGRRLEAIGAVFRDAFPPELPRRARAAAAREPDPGAPRETAVLPEGAEARATASVVRLCRSRERYLAYGGPPGTGGYWSDEALELVLYDDREVLGREQTWRALNHEAFHQYMHHYLDGAEAHPWFDEGHGDWFGAFAWRRGRFEAEVHAERRRAARELLRAGSELPLREFLRLPKRRYYAEGPGGVDEARRAANYAQGWSFVHFLRSAEPGRRGFEPSWAAILGKYVEGLLGGLGRERALELAFEGVDWRALEDSWRAYTLE